ncbi:hypothetical protein DFH09DRAFT_1339689 [Mycena vulgaris]|nr:hypothetical protein DFH09DRAFT_1339689 [Mycena vulgaris]
MCARLGGWDRQEGEEEEEVRRTSVEPEADSAPAPAASFMTPPTWRAPVVPPRAELGLGLGHRGEHQADTSQQKEKQREDREEQAEEEEQEEQPPTCLLTFAYTHGGQLWNASVLSGVRVPALGTATRSNDNANGNGLDFTRNANGTVNAHLQDTNIKEEDTN